MIGLPLFGLCRFSGLRVAAPASCWCSPRAGGDLVAPLMPWVVVDGSLPSPLLPLPSGSFLLELVPFPLLLSSCWSPSCLLLVTWLLWCWLVVVLCACLLCSLASPGTGLLCSPGCLGVVASSPLLVRMNLWGMRGDESMCLLMLVVFRGIEPGCLGCSWLAMSWL